MPFGALPLAKSTKTCVCDVALCSPVVVTIALPMAGDSGQMKVNISGMYRVILVLVPVNIRNRKA